MCAQGCFISVHLKVRNAERLWDCEPKYQNNIKTVNIYKVKKKKGGRDKIATTHVKNVPSLIMKQHDQSYPAHMLLMKTNLALHIEYGHMQTGGKGYFSQ